MKNICRVAVIVCMAIAFCLSGRGKNEDNSYIHEIIPDTDESAPAAAEVALSTEGNDKGTDQSSSDTATDLTMETVITLFNEGYTLSEYNASI